MNNRNIYLIGYRCTGKTTIGKALSGKLGWEFMDSDVELVRTAGRSIKDIVESDGWDVFRRIERRVIKSICKLDSRVVATGGGVVLNDDNVSNMRETGKLIWLKASADTIKTRLMNDQSSAAYRPSLTHRGLLEEVEEILRCREPLYEKAADFSIITDHMSKDAAVDMILCELGKRKNP
ncbi:MAG: shikimate kinase [Deltaproteobacteria bacterium]|nr:shikimate kinase [Deltaproteobacteria bacterium]MBW1962769.1 shikimate kinase [Deltaproteobacteria bacterium]MBW1995936.1 shikimate kinase [Deltaproteobacteria bacterium]MBW2153542.1 shikimate kinase [Deltaproteobacteria bacterium]